MIQSSDTLDDGAPVPGRPVPPSARTFELAGHAGRLSAIRHGDPAPGRGWVLLTPGFLGSKEDFSTVLDPLAARGWGVLAFSQRGQYRSEGPGGSGPTSSREGYHLGDFADDLLAVAAQVDETRPVHLVGHSFGGVVAIEALTREPAAFASYTHWNSGPRTRYAHGYAVDHVAAGGSAALEPWAAAGLSGAEADWARARVRATRSGYLLGAAMILLEQEDRAAELAATGVPLLVAHGELDDRWPIAWQREMAARAGASYAIVPNAGHGAQLDAPEASAALLDAFWTGAPLPGGQIPEG